MANELIGKRIGGCDITGVIGRGGMAIVYRAHQVSMNRPVAIKMLPRQFVEDPLYMQRFEREVRIVAQLEHRNIVPVHDYGEYEGQPFIVMRLMDGGSVDDLIRKHRRLTLDHLRDIITQIAPALDYAHAKGVLHRDLKPSNILLDDDGGAYLSDFGIARMMNETATDAASPLTVTGVIGTPSYMSPEQAQGKPLDGRSDVYALGICMFEMVTGVRPFDGETPYSIAVKQVTETPPAPRSLNPLLPVAVEAVILRAMRKHAADRFANTVTLAEALLTAITAPAVDPLLDTLPSPALTSVGAAAEDPMRSTQQRQRPATPPGMTGIAAAPVTPPPAGFTPASAFSPPASVPLPRVRRSGGGMVTAMLVGLLLGCVVLSLLAGAGALLLNLTAATTTPSPTPTGESSTGTPTATRPGAAALPTRTAIGAVPPTAPVGARPSPTGIPGLGTILFCSERDGQFDIFLLDLATRLETRLSNDPGNDMFATPSPDGARIAFQSDRDGDFDIYVMRADGSEVQQVTDNAVTDRQPAWTPDGAALYYASDTRGDGAHDLYRVDLATGAITLVYSDGGRISQPRVSPDGAAVVFTSGRPDDASTWDIKRLDLASAQVTFLTGSGKEFAPTFTPDGGLIYLTEGLGFSAIWRMAADGEDAVVLYDGPGYENNPAAHPRESVILFASDASGRDELYIMNSDGVNVRQITETGASSGEWMP